MLKTHQLIRLAVLAIGVATATAVLQPLRAADAIEPPAGKATTRPSPDNAKPAPDADNFFNTPYMLRGYCYAGSDIKDEQALGGFGVSDNMPRKITNPAALKTGTWYLLAEPEVVMPQGKQQGMRLTLVNATGKPLAFSACDSRLSIVQEAIDDKGVWRSVESLPSSFCGNSYHRLTLEPGKFWAFAAPRYQGEHKIRLRFRIDVPAGPVYSNEFEGSVNLTQFTTQQPYRPVGIMDPNHEVPATQPVP